MDHTASTCDVRVGRLLPAASHVLVYCLKGSRLLGEEKRPQRETMVACAFPASSLHFLPAGSAPWERPHSRTGPAPPSLPALCNFPCAVRELGDALGLSPGWKGADF